MTTERTPERTLHDLLVASKPAGSDHDPAACPFCTTAAEGETAVPQPRTYTEDELRAQVDAAVAQVTASMNARIVELESSQQQVEFDSAVAAAVTPLQAEIADVRGQLDTAVAEANAERTRREELEAFLAAEAERAETAAAAAARRDERVAAVRDIGIFPDEHLDANADRWAAMDDDGFASQLADYRALASRVGAPPAAAAAVPAGPNEPPARTAMTAAAAGRPQGGKAPLTKQAAAYLRTGKLQLPAGV